MSKVTVELEVFFDGSDGEPTKEETKEFVTAMINNGAECSGACSVDILNMHVNQSPTQTN